MPNSIFNNQILALLRPNMAQAFPIAKSKFGKGEQYCPAPTHCHWSGTSCSSLQLQDLLLSCYTTSHSGLTAKAATDLSLPQCLAPPHVSVSPPDGQGPPPCSRSRSRLPPVLDRYWHSCSIMYIVCLLRFYMPQLVIPSSSGTPSPDSWPHITWPQNESTCLQARQTV